MNIRDKSGYLTPSAQSARSDFRIQDISEIVDVVINPNSNPIISYIIEKWKNELGYDGCVYMAINSYFTYSRSIDKVLPNNKEYILINSLIKMMKDAYLDGIQPEIFEITAICIIYVVKKRMIIHMPWLSDNQKKIILNILRWSNKYLDLLQNDNFFKNMIFCIHHACWSEICVRESMNKYMSNTYSDIMLKDIKANDFYDDFNR